MKDIFIAAVVLILLGSGFVYFSKHPSVPPQDTTSSAQKLNIDEVCKSALAYTTFPDAASSDLFIAECKEGKHPEVIERYKAEMNLGDGATI